MPEKIRVRWVSEHGKKKTDMKYGGTGINTQDIKVMCLKNLNIIS